MAVLQLSKEDTYRLMLYARKLAWWKRKQVFTTKTRELCLGCKEPIYVSFSQFDNAAIFCDNCQDRVNRKNMVQSQYIRVIKERQLLLIEGTTQHIMDDIGSYTKSNE
jgi:hypothetical protein